MKFFTLFLLIFFCVGYSFPGTSGQNKSVLAPETLKINQLQIIASHNSYHLKTEPAIFRFLSFIHALGILPSSYNPQYIDYSNASLTEQLDKYGLRGLELDVWNDPEGNRFYKRAGRKFVWKKASSKIAALQPPGFKILHIPDFDFNTTNYTFKDALQEIKKWSEAHPNHLPVFINIETEVSAPGNQIHMLRGLAKAAPFDSTAANNLDKEVKDVFGEKLNGVITPDEVRSNYTTLEQAALAGNWPTLASARGKIIFIIDADGQSGNVYKAGHSSLQGRAMFVYSKPGEAEAAFVIANDPVKEHERIQQLVKQGYILRTRSDENTWEARQGDYSRINAAFTSGAQIVSTDYYRPDPRAGKHGWTNYHVQFFSNTMARVDSISGASLINAPITEQ